MDISNPVNHAHNAAFRYLNEARDYISYEHDPADEIRYFNFEKVVHKNGCYSEFLDFFDQVLFINRSE